MRRENKLQILKSKNNIIKVKIENKHMLNKAFYKIPAYKQTRQNKFRYEILHEIQLANSKAKKQKLWNKQQLQKCTF